MSAIAELAWVTAEVKRPCVEIDLAGACITQSAIDMLIELLRNSANDFDVCDLHIKRVSRTAIPSLTVEFK